MINDLTLPKRMVSGQFTDAFRMDNSNNVGQAEEDVQEEELVSMSR